MPSVDEVSPVRPPVFLSQVLDERVRVTVIDDGSGVEHHAEPSFSQPKGKVDILSTSHGEACIEAPLIEEHSPEVRRGVGADEVDGFAPPQPLVAFLDLDLREARRPLPLLRAIGTLNADDPG